MIEVEIKAKVNNFVQIKNKLLELGADFVDVKTQIDHIYGRKQDQDNEHKLIEGSFSARIRQVNDKIRLDFKEIIRGAGGMEVSIPFTSIEQADRFLTKIDYEKAFIINKRRKTFKLYNVTIALDDVEKLGHFIEIEICTEHENEKEMLYEECKKYLHRIVPEARVKKKKYGDLMQELINQKL